MFSPEALAFTVVAFGSTSLGGFFALRYKKDLVLFLAYAAGALVGIAFFDLFPEALNLILSQGSDIFLAMYALVVGFMYYHLMERSVVIHSHSKSIHSAKTGNAVPNLTSIGTVAAASLSVHSTLDGFAIGIAFQIGTPVGLFVALAVVLHDFSDGLNTVTVMLRSGNSTLQSFKLLLVDAIAPIIGVAVSFVIVIPEIFLALLLAFFAGEFLSIGATDLLPEADHKETSWRIVLFTVIGVAFIFVLIRLVSFP